MPLYSYIPYLDPDIDEKEKKSFSGHIIDTDDETDNLNLETKLPTKTPVDTFKRKVNENLKNFNCRMSDLLQDGLGGVDSICKQVKGFIYDNPKQISSDKNMEKCARGDDFECSEEKKYNSPATDPSQDAMLKIHRQGPNSVFAMQKPQETLETKEDPLTPSPKKSQPRSRPTSKNLKSKKSDPKCSTPRLSSRSFNTALKTSESKRSSEKIKSPKTKTKKKAVEVETKEEDKARPACAKKRLGQIERDYQKVVENLGMVERMMACVNERILNQKNKGHPESQETVNSEEKNSDVLKSKKKALKVADKKTKTTKQDSTDEFIPLNSDEPTEDRKSSGVIKEDKKLEDKTPTKETKDLTRRKKKETKESQEKKPSKEIFKKTVEEPIKQIEEVEETDQIRINETKKKAEQLRALNPLSRIQINDSLSDIDALIDNAVMELGNLVSTDFDISQSSSDVSFKLVVEDGGQILNDDCTLIASSSNTSASGNELLGEESEKFEISKSFQELKDSYVQKIKQEATVKKKEKKKPKKPKAEKKEMPKKNSFDQLHEEIFNDSSWNRLDPFECTFLKDPPKDSNSSIDSSSKPIEEIDVPNQESSTSKKRAKKEQDIRGEDQNYAVMEALMHTKMENINSDEENEEVITISLPSERRTKSAKKSGDFIPNIQNVDTQQIDDETLQITVTLKGDQEETILEDRKKPVIQQVVSESELGENPQNFEANRRQERTLRKQQKKKIKDKKAAKTTNKEKGEKTPNTPKPRSKDCEKTPKSQSKEEEQLQAGEEIDNLTTVDVCKKESAEDTPVDTLRPKTKPKLKRKPKKVPQSTIEITPVPSKDIKEIKKMESNFSVCSSYSSTSSLEEGMFWTHENLKKEDTKPMDPMKPISIQCKKLIGDLVVEDDNISLQKLMDGYFNASLIRSLVGRPKRPRSVRIHTPIQDPDLRSIVPEVHRKKAISDLHERMEYQIRQTDSFDGFLNLMNKTRRKALIKQAERQDHNLRCHMKTCFRKRYPFRVVTASVPAGYDKSKEKKDPEKKYINSLWFSPKDFKLRRNSRIFNRKRMEMYCQTLHKGPMIPRCKCAEVASRESKKSEKAANYSILVRSGTPLGRRPNTPRRWIQLRPPSSTGGHSQRPRLHHCDILDDLTLKDLAPFNAEYPRNDERHITESLQGSLLYKLACGGHKGDADGTLMELVAPKLSCTQNDCKICKFKSKSDKKPARRVKSAKKSGDEASVTSTKTNELQSLTAKAAAQLLMQNIGEIKSKKSTTKSQASDKNLIKHKETKSKRSVKSLRKNSKKILAQDSKAAIHQRLEENLVKKIFCNQHVPMIEFVPKSINPQKFGAFKGVDPFQKPLKVPELYPRPPGRKSNIGKLFPYINDPDNKVFQNITVLPVKVFYDFEPLKDCSEKALDSEVAENLEFNPPRNVPPINVTSLSETDELEVSTVERQRPSTAGDRNVKKKMTGRRRNGTPKSPTLGCRQNPNKFNNIPPNRHQPIDVTLTRKSREIISLNQDQMNAKNPPRRTRCRRSNSLGKSTESDNPVEGALFENHNFRPKFPLPASQCLNPKPWKPASRRPRTPKTPPVPKSPIRIRSKERSNFQQTQPLRTVSNGRISPRQNARLLQKANDRSLPDTAQETKDQPQMQTLVNKEKRLRFEVNPTKAFYDIDFTEPRPSTTRTPVHRCRPLSPSQKVMVDHLHMLRNRNTKLQGNIQKAINIIEEKMVDVLSTNDQNYKKRTIDRMEKEINKVLKMINEQGCKHNKNEDESPIFTSNVRKTSSKSEAVDLVDASIKPKSEEESTTKALVSSTMRLKMPRPPRKRSISRVLKFHSRPSTVEEERRFDLAEEPELFRINEGAASDEEEAPICKPQEDRKEEQEHNLIPTKKREELYPSNVIGEEGEAPLCPVLRCPTPKASCTGLTQKTKGILRKMSKEAFGKFADVVKTKTRLIIDMTERIDVDDSNLLPSPKITSALPAILARSKLPVITTIHQPRTTADLMSTTVSSIVSVHQAPLESIADALSGATTEISEFANGCAERSITSFSESESYTWRKIEQSQAMDLGCSACSLKRKISHDLTPFMRALKNLKAGSLFDKRHQLLPIEETSPNFRKLMGFLEGLSKVKETLNHNTMKDVQLMWNPEKRCSFHSSIAGSTKLRFRRNTKAISEHSIVQSPTSSFSDLLSRTRIEEKPSEPTEVTNEETQKEEKNEIEEPQHVLKESKELYQLQPDIQKNKGVKLVFSEVHLISISNTKSNMKKHRKKTSLECKKAVMLKDERYSSFLKFFYLIFYTFVYFCMTSMNFSC